MAAEQSPETRDFTRTRARDWCLTLWSMEDVARLESLETAVLVVGKETCPKTAREHYHAYVRFRNARAFRSIKMHFPNAHLEPRFGTEAQAIQYATKDGEIIINRITDGSASRVERVAKSGEVELEVHRRLREGESIRSIWADHPIYCARNMRMLRAVVRIYDAWGHRSDGNTVENLSGIEL